VHHSQLADDEIDVAPAQRYYLAAPQTAQDREQRRDAHPLPSYRFDQFGGLCEIVSLHGTAHDLGRTDGSGRVANQHFPFDSLGEGTF
jgi:hypothetical protein